EQPLAPEPEAESNESAPLARDSAALPVPWVLCARSQAALKGQAQRLLDHLADTPEQSVLDLSFSLAVRPLLEHRAVVTGESYEQLIEGVSALAAGQAHARLSSAVAGEGGKLAYLF